METMSEVKKVTIKPEEAQSTIAFLKANFAETIEEGCRAADRLAQMFEGRKVRRSYFMPKEAQDASPKFLPIIIQIVKVRVKGAGIVVLYDSNGNVRTFPALLFKFVFRPDDQAVICIGPKFTVLLEVVA